MADDSLLDDETTITELTIAPDGRIFIFGMSRSVLELCAALPWNSPDVQQRLDALRQVEAPDSDGQPDCATIEEKSP